MEKQHVPGMTIGIIKNGKLVRTGTYGKSDLELDVKTKLDDLFEIGSMTKQFTAFATMMLVEEGKVGLDEPVESYLPEYPDKWKGVKVRNLLNQTSGLPEYALVPGLGLVENFDRATFFKKLSELPMDFQPGVTWAYSNTNYALLGWIIEKASGKNYTEFVTERMLKPLGMTHTVYGNQDTILPHRAHGYIIDQGKLYRARPSAASIESDGSILSNIADLAKWDAALREKKLLKPESYDFMWTPAKLNSGRSRFYGTGWFLNPFGKGTRYMGHGGNSSGYSGGIARYPEKNLSVVVLANVYAINGEGFAKSLAEMTDPSIKFAVPAAAGSDPDPARTDRVKTALGKLGSGDFDTQYLEPEAFAAQKTSRAAAFGGNSPLKSIKALSFVSAQPFGSDTLVEYRMEAANRMFTAEVLYSADGKVANAILLADPPKPVKA